MTTRKNYKSGFKAKVVLEALKGKQTDSELASRFGVHTTLIHQRKKVLLENAPIFSSAGRARKKLRLIRARSKTFMLKSAN